MEKNISDLATLSALAEIRKHQIIQAKFNNQTESLYPDSYVYAIAKSVYPIFQEDSSDNYDDESEKIFYCPFYKTYKISHEQVTDVHHYLTQQWQRGIKFQEVESHYKKVWGATDVEDFLIVICRYLYLAGNFDTKFWDNLILNRNQRVLQIIEKFRLSEVFPFLNS